MNFSKWWNDEILESLILILNGAKKITVETPNVPFWHNIQRVRTKKLFSNTSLKTKQKIFTRKPTHGYHRKKGQQKNVYKKMYHLAYFYFIFHDHYYFILYDDFFYEYWRMNIQDLFFFCIFLFKFSILISLW